MHIKKHIKQVEKKILKKMMKAKTFFYISRPDRLTKFIFEKTKFHQTNKLMIYDFDTCSPSENWELHL